MSCRVSEVWNLKCVVKRAKQPNLPLLGGDTPPRRLRRELGSSLPSTGTASGAQSVTSCCAETSFLLMESRQPRFLPWAHLYSTNLFSQNGFSALSGSPLLQLGLNMANPPPPTLLQRRDFEAYYSRSTSPAGTCAPSGCHLLQRWTL